MDTVWSWCEFQNLVSSLRLVQRLQKLCTTRTAHISPFYIRERCKTGIYFLRILFLLKCQSTMCMLACMQMTYIHSQTASMKLNASKCQIVVFVKFSCERWRKVLRLHIEIKSFLHMSVLQEWIQKARKAFFQFGSVHAFQGNLSPISTSSIVQCCVLLVLLYGAENWVMPAESLRRLKYWYFQGEIAKKIAQMVV